MNHGATTLLDRAARLAQALLMAMLVHSGAAAQATQPSAQLSQYRMPPLSSDGVAVAEPSVPAHLVLSGRIAVDYANDPLVFEAGQGQATSERFSLVAHQAVAQVAVGLGLLDDYALFVGLPLQLVLAGDELAGQPQGNGALLGDLSLGGRARLVEDGGWGLALQLGLTASTSPDSDEAPGVAGESGTTVSGQLLGRYEDGPYAMVLNAGLYLRKDKAFAGLEFSNELTFALALRWRALRWLSVSAESFGRTPMARVGDAGTTAIEALLAASVHLPERIIVGLAGGTGLTRGYGAPDLRILASASVELPLGAPPGPPPGNATEADDTTNTEDSLDPPLAEGEHGAPQAPSSEPEFEPIHTDY